MLEVTGGLETLVVGTLIEATFPTAVINPRRARDFAKALGQLAKTDALDAEVLARFAKPASSRVTRMRSRIGQAATSRWALATSIPTQQSTGVGAGPGAVMTSGTIPAGRITPAGGGAKGPASVDSG